MKAIIRTVKQGRVKIKGRTYSPDQTHLPYDGRLDGKRFVFALYAGQPDLAGLWGSEAMYRDKTGGYGAECVDGSFPWAFWREV